MATPLPYISASTSRCPRCDGNQIRPALMTGFGAYWRCTPCGHSWLVPRSQASVNERDQSTNTTSKAVGAGAAGWRFR